MSDHKVYITKWSYCRYLNIRKQLDWRVYIIRVSIRLWKVKHRSCR